MNDDDRQKRLAASEDRFTRQIAAKTARKRRALNRRRTGVWYGLGMSGLIGWSVAVPTVGGALLGLWLDGRHPGGQSWTLVLLVAGLVIGGANAWHWVAREQKALRNDDEDEEDCDE
ncbi:AtpZ/AtpI family protein [Salinisphaera sp. RV14]|uniref:AtpZ/AtpI family protein n=1 Tax=unclassified Salinisphaera TaxID=2649847 RepID=UPI003F84CA90